MNADDSPVKILDGKRYKVPWGVSFVWTQERGNSGEKGCVFNSVFNSHINLISLPPKIQVEKNGWPILPLCLLRGDDRN